MDEDVFCGFLSDDLFETPSFLQRSRTGQDRGDIQFIVEPLWFQQVTALQSSQQTIEAVKAHSDCLFLQKKYDDALHCYLWLLENTSNVGPLTWTVASSGRLTELRTQPVRCANAISVSRHNTDRSGDTYNNIAEHIGAPIKTNRSKKGSATPQLRRDVLECVCRCLIHLQKYTEALKFSELLVREFAEESDLWFIHGLILSHLNSPHWKGDVWSMRQTPSGRFRHP